MTMVRNHWKGGDYHDKNFVSFFLIVKSLETLSIGGRLFEFPRGAFASNKTIDNWFTMNEASLPKRLFSFRPITLNFSSPLKDAVFPNTILVGDALAGKWFDVEKYFNEFQKRLNSTGDPNKIY